MAWGSKKEEVKPEPAPVLQPPPVQPTEVKADAKIPFSLSSLWTKVPLANPGKYDDFDREMKSVFNLPQETFGGYKIDIASPISQATLITHSFSLGDRMREDQYAIGFHHGITANAALTGRAETSGGMTLRVIGSAWDSVIGSIQFQGLKGQLWRSLSTAGDITYAGTDFSLMAKMSNDLTPQVSYMQAVTPKLAVGGELAYGIRNGMAVGSFGMRYAGDRDVFTAQYTTIGHAAFGYTRVVTDNCMLCSNLIVDMSKRETALQVGYNYALSVGSIRGTIDSMGMARTILNVPFLPGLNATISGELEYQQKNARFGVGLSME